MGALPQRSPKSCNTSNHNLIIGLRTQQKHVVFDRPHLHFDLGPILKTAPCTDLDDTFDYS